MSEDANNSAPVELMGLDLDTGNYTMWTAGQNLPNHSATIAGHGRFVAPAISVMPQALQFRTKDDAYRTAAWLVTLAESWLPDNDMAHPHTFADYLQAVRNT